MLEEFNYNNNNHREFFFKLLNDSEICKYLGRGQIIDLIKANIIRKYILTIDGNLVGIGFIQPLRENEIEIRYGILKEYRGKKYSSLLVHNLINKIGTNVTIYADIQNDNYASAKAVLNNGFTTEDNFIYQMKR